MIRISALFLVYDDSNSEFNEWSQVKSCTSSDLVHASDHWQAHAIYMSPSLTRPIVCEHAYQSPADPSPPLGGPNVRPRLARKLPND